MAVEWHRTNSYESALTEDCVLATEKLCPSVTRVCRVSKPRSNAVRISPEQDVWKACTRELFLEFLDLTYKVKLARNGTSVKYFSFLILNKKYICILRVVIVIINFVQRNTSVI